MKQTHRNVLLVLFALVIVTSMAFAATHLANKAEYFTTIVRSRSSGYGGGAMFVPVYGVGGGGTTIVNNNNNNNADGGGGGVSQSSTTTTSRDPNAYLYSLIGIFLVLLFFGLIFWLIVSQPYGNYSDVIHIKDGKKDVIVV